MNLLENLQKHILDIPAGTPEKKVWWYLACYNRAHCKGQVPFPAYQLALALWSDLAGSNHPACPRGNSIQQTLGRNARLLERPSHHFLTNRERFQAPCLQTKFRMSARKKISRDLAFKTILGDCSIQVSIEQRQ